MVVDVYFGVEEDQTFSDPVPRAVLVSAEVQIRNTRSDGAEIITCKTFYARDVDSLNAQVEDFLNG